MKKISARYAASVFVALMLLVNCKKTEEPLPDEATLNLSQNTKTGATVSSVPITTDIAHWWPGEYTPFDRMQTGPNDQSVLAVASIVPGRIGNAFSFDGTVFNYVQIPYSATQAGMPQLTIDAWFKSTSSQFTHAGNGSSIISKLNSYHIWLQNDGSLRATLSTSSSTASVTTPPLIITTFHHVAMTYDGSNMRLYLDGVEQGSTPMSGPVFDYVVFNNPQQLHIGALRVPGNDLPMYGLIDEVHLFHRALSAAEINQIYTAGLQGKDLSQIFEDQDGDGIADDVDNCPTDPNPSQADFDNDGTGDECDYCYIDGDGDSDGDRICDSFDNCTGTANPDQNDSDSDGQGDACDVCPQSDLNDYDGDGICGDIDNCPSANNPNQLDSDGDGQGDACDVCPYGSGDADADEDKVCDGDNCPNTSNVTQADADNDRVGDACDNCPEVGNTDQADADGDRIGDACEPSTDADSDGISDDVDNCPQIANNTQLDTDGDGVGNDCDNCPTKPNPTQDDTDGDGIGNVCEPPAIITAPIDIKPGTFPNPINCHPNDDKGVIPVAVLTTPTFDATTINPLTLRFGRNGTEAAEQHGKGHLEDVDGDGDLDMMLHFRYHLTGIQCGDTQAKLTGKTMDNNLFQGSDLIQTH